MLVVGCKKLQALQTLEVLPEPLLVAGALLPWRMEQGLHRQRKQLSVAVFVREFTRIGSTA